MLFLLNKLLEENTGVFDTVTEVIIELQPKFNPKMCFVSHTLFAKLCDYYALQPGKMKFERAGNKLKNYSGDKGVFVKNTYKNSANRCAKGIRFSCAKNGKSY